MKRGICPQCGSTDVKSGARIPGKEGLNGSNRLPLSHTRHVPVDNYVCPQCGYTESYIQNRNTLNRIANEWQRVPRATPAD
jgi:predicted nucleic-acid-binding Zn-ribbon protein